MPPPHSCARTRTRIDTILHMRHKGEPPSPVGTTAGGGTEGGSWSGPPTTPPVTLESTSNSSGDLNIANKTPSFVCRSNSWTLTRPKWIILESLGWREHRWEEPNNRSGKTSKRTGRLRMDEGMDVPEEAARRLSGRRTAASDGWYGPQPSIDAMRYHQMCPHPMALG